MLKDSMCLTIAWLVLCIPSTLAKKTDFQPTTDDFMKVLNFDVSDLRGVIQSSFHELDQSPDAQLLMKRTIQPHAPNMDLGNVAADLKEKVMPTIPEHSQMSLDLHLTSDDRAVALSFLDKKGNSLRTVALPNIKMPAATMQTIEKALSRVHGIKVAKPLKMPMAPGMLLEASMKEIESVLEADSAIVTRDAFSTGTSLERRQGFSGLFLLLGPIPLAVVGVVLLVAGIVTLVAKGTAGESMTAGWIVFGVGMGCIVAGGALGYAMLKKANLAKS